MTGLTVGALSLLEVTGCPSLLLNRASSRDIQGYGRPSLVCETRKSALGVVNTTGPKHGWLHLSLPSSSSVLGARNTDSNKYAACSSVRVQATVAPAEASEVSDDTSFSADEHAGMQSTHLPRQFRHRGREASSTAQSLPAERSIVYTGGCVCIMTVRSTMWCHHAQGSAVLQVFLPKIKNLK